MDLIVLMTEQTNNTQLKIEIFVSKAVGVVVSGFMR